MSDLKKVFEGLGKSYNEVGWINNIIITYKRLKLSLRERAKLLQTVDLLNLLLRSPHSERFRGYLR